MNKRWCNNNKSIFSLQGGGDTPTRLMKLMSVPPSRKNSCHEVNVGSTIKKDSVDICPLNRQVIIINNSTTTEESVFDGGIYLCGWIFIIMTITMAICLLGCMLTDGVQQCSKTSRDINRSLNVIDL
jgi:hypothetical protein